MGSEVIKLRRIYERARKTRQNYTPHKRSEDAVSITSEHRGSRGAREKAESVSELRKSLSLQLTIEAMRIFSRPIVLRGNDRVERVEIADEESKGVRTTKHRCTLGPKKNKKC